MNRRTSNDTTPHAFIVRVYRCTADGLAGQVQDTLTGRIRVFRCMEELWTALGGDPQPRQCSAPAGQTNDEEQS
jgi:hypothetical protein